MTDPTPAPPGFVDPLDAAGWDICPTCRGTGYLRVDHTPRPCDHCGHAGIIAVGARWLCETCVKAGQ
jgi:DnaJ-class molecular chaperone